MFTSLKKIFAGDPLKKFEGTIAAINELEASIAALTDEQLKEESLTLHGKVREEEFEPEHIERGFALAREAAKRTLGQRPYDVQLVGGLVLHSGAVAEMATGEGKTLSAVAPAYLNGLKGEGVHVVTVNEYLARRDAVWMGRVYHALGLSVACLVPSGAFLYDPEWKVPEDGRKLLDEAEKSTGSFIVQQEYLRPITRREAYQADITYGTNHEFGFDYLRDNLAYQIEGQTQRRHPFAIIDEVDSILIDEARTPLIIAAPDAQSSEYYKTFARVVTNLQPGEEKDYIIDEKLKSVTITESGIEKVEKVIGVENLYAPEQLRLVHYLEESLKAKALFLLDRDYVVKNGEIVIVDEFTGRLLQGRRYNGGLHQAIEAKEGVLVKEESRTYAKISIQNYFRMYKKIAGMTGTGQTSAEEFFKVYALEVMSIPTHRPNVRRDEQDIIYKNLEVKMQAIANDIRERHKKGQPVLVGTTSIEKNEMLSAYLKRAGITHEVLNAKNNEREGAIIAQAGRLKAVTVATNMAGRGVDIILGGNPANAEQAKVVRELGGLHVIGTERHEARRIDNQLRGRTARQGDPGSTQFFLSLEDDLVRVFGGDRIKNLMERFNLPEDQPIQMSFVSKAVAEAQAKVEGANFDMRKHLLEYDDVLNKQRAAVYKKRQDILESLNREHLANTIYEASTAFIEKLYEAQTIAIEKADKEGPAQDGAESEEKKEAAATPEKALLRAATEAALFTQQHPIDEEAGHPDDFKDILTKRSLEVTLDPLTLNRVLSVLDMLWMTHLEDLDALAESVRLRAYGQRDPLVEYRREASDLYRTLWDNFNAWIFMNVFKAAQLPGAAQVHGGNGHLHPHQHQHAAPASALPAHATTNAPAQQAVAADKVGRNDPCPCGSGKKYKHCHGK